MVYTVHVPCCEIRRSTSDKARSSCFDTSSADAANSNRRLLKNKQSNIGSNKNTGLLSGDLKHAIRPTGRTLAFSLAY